MSIIQYGTGTVPFKITKYRYIIHDTYLLHAIDFGGNTHNAGRSLADLDEVLQIVSRIARRHDHLQRRPKLLVRQAGGLLLPLFRGSRRYGGRRRGQLGRNLGRVGNKKPTPKNTKNPPKKPLKMFFFYFLIFFGNKIVQTFLFERDFS
jgi:hypothetical protein